MTPYEQQPNHRDIGHRNTETIPQATQAALLAVGPPSDPVECLAYDSGNGLTLPKRLVDDTVTGVKAAAEELAKDCPAVSSWELTTRSEQYGYWNISPLPVDMTVHVFLIIASKKGREQDGYRWVPLANHPSDFTSKTYSLPELKRVLDQYNLDDLSVDAASVSDSFEMSAEGRAEKVDQDTTLTDF